MKRCQGALNGRRPRYESTLYTDRIGRQRKSSGADTGRGTLIRLVGYQPVDRIDFVLEVAEGFALKSINLYVDDTVHLAQ
jgi:hypothetical protein